MSKKKEKRKKGKTIYKLSSGDKILSSAIEKV